MGLQVGAAGDELRCGAEGSADVAPVVLVALEVDDAALDEAARLGARVVVSHHPLIFDPLERLSDDTEAGRLALRAAREGVAVIAAHTNLDKARGGIADVVAGMLGLEAVAAARAGRRRRAQARRVRARATTPTSCARPCSPPAPA